MGTYIYNRNESPQTKIQEEDAMIEPIGEYYFDQEQPTENDFKINATPDTTDYIQAAIETGRLIYPSFELFIQAAEAVNVLPSRRRRGLYPLYFKDASPYEIFKIYEGGSAALARTFLKQILGANIDDFMGERGYSRTYFGFVNDNNVSVQASKNILDFNRNTFEASITPADAVLMEMTRKRSLNESASAPLRHLFGLETPQYEEPSPKIRTFGFNRNILRRAVRPFLIDQRRSRIMHPGENAITIYGSDRSSKTIQLAKTASNAYYMALYNELKNIRF
jgi:hypothetical protein